MTPLRSISQIPELQSGAVDEFFEHIEQESNSEVTQYKIDTNTYLSALTSDKLYIEVSYKDPATSSFLSRRLDFGKLLRYLEDSLSILNNAIIGNYLTRSQADDLYLPLAGGTLTGPLTIDYTNGGSRPTVTSQALTINATRDGDVPVGIVINNDAPISFGNGNTYITKTGITTKQLNSSIGINCDGITTTTHLSVTDSFKLPFFELKDNKLKVTAPIDANTDASPITAKSMTTANLTVTNDLHLTENLTVDKKIQTLSLNVTGATTVNTLSASAAITGNNFVATTANDDDNAFKAAHGIVVAPKINGTKSVFVDDTLKMTTADGLVATSKISQLTAQYACWA